MKANTMTDGIDDDELADALSENGLDRDDLGRRVREVWIAWAKKQANPKPSWLVPWTEMSEPDREVDRQIGETIAYEATKKATEFLRNEVREEQAARNREINRANHWQVEAGKSGLSARRAAMATLALLLLVLGVVAWVQRSMPEPTECPSTACPACEVCEAPPTVPTAGENSEGYLVEGEFGGLRLVPWPDASAYPAEQFTSDCSAVCSVPSPMDHEPGRVLVVDPAHLVCVCFHRESSFPVTRWINWERGPR